MEHVERQDEREAELRTEVDELDQQGDQLEERAKRVDEQIGEAREDHERKQDSSEAPGMQGEETTTMIESEGSEVDPRPGTSDNPGAAEDEGQATGNPPNDDAPAGDEDE